MAFFIRTYMCSIVNHVQLFVILQTTACQTPLSLGFSRLEYWNGLTLPSLGDLPNPGTDSPSPAQQVDSFATVSSEQTDKILNSVKYLIYVKISLFFAKICHYREVSGKVKHNLTLFILLFSGIEILEVLI